MTAFVFINSLIDFFNEQPILVLCFLYLLVYYKDLKPIKVSLNNHITDTNKKIGDLKAGQDKLEAELKAGQNKLDNLINILLSNKVDVISPKK